MIVEQLRELESVILDGAWRGALLLAATFMLSAAVRRHSAALRHLLFVGAMVGLIAVVVLASRGPELELPAQGLVVDRGGSGGHALVPTAPSSEFGNLLSTPDFMPEADYDRLPMMGTRATPALEVASATSDPILPWVAIVWLAGCALWAARIFVGLRLLGRIIGTSSRAPGTLRRELSSIAGADRVRLHLADERSSTFTPMATGIFCPIILLPATATTWESAKIRSVLHHEMAHIRRRDVLVDLICQLAVALHWFNPLAWLALRKIRVVREVACDDRVLHTGCRASDYAEHLFELGSHQGRAVPALATQMAGADQLEPRIRTVLDPRLRRDHVSKLAWAATMGFTSLVVLLTITRLTYVEPPVETDRSTVSPKGLTFSTDKLLAVAESAADGERGHLRLEDLASAETLWDIETKFPPHDRPTIWSDRVFLMTTDRTLHCFHSVSGRKIWSHATPARDEFFFEGVFDAEGSPHALLSTLSDIHMVVDIKTGGRRALEIPPLSVVPETQPVPSQFHDAYLKEKPADFINDPQQLLPKDLREDLADQLRNHSILHQGNIQVLVLSADQEFPSDVSALYTKWFSEISSKRPPPEEVALLRQASKRGRNRAHPPPDVSRSLLGISRSA